MTAAAGVQFRPAGSQLNSTNVSKPWARLVARETRGLADTPTVVMPARAACSAHVVTASLSSSPRPRSSSSTGWLLTAPWLRGCRPLRSEATDGRVQLDCATACSNTNPSAARRSSVGVRLGSAP